METNLDPGPDERDLVPDEATALQIGTAILKAYLGQERFEQFEPYSAHLMFGTWAVFGDSPALKAARIEQQRLGPDHLTMVRGGGAPCVEFSPRDAQAKRPYFQR